MLGWLTILGCGVCIVRGENDECACLCITYKVCFLQQQKCKCKTQAKKKTPKRHIHLIEKKVKLFSSVRPPQQKSDTH